MAIPAIEAVHLNSFRDRVISLISSPAALKIDFQVDHIRFTGYVAFPAVTAGLAWAMNGGPGRPGLNIEFGPSPSGGAASYYPATNTFYFRYWYWGFKPFERQAIIHEATHAWLDMLATIRKPADVLPATKWMRTTTLTSEAIAYMAGLLFAIYDTTPPGRTPTVPDWVATAIPPVFRIAYDIAVKIKDKPGAVVPAADVTELKEAIKSDSYELQQNPWQFAGYNGV